MASDAEKRAAKNKALANSAKGKTQTPTADAARRAANKETSQAKVVKVNSNPNPTPAKGVRNPTKAMNNARIDIHGRDVYKETNNASQGSKINYKDKPIKIRTSGLQGRGGSLGGIHMGGSGMNWETK